MLKSSYYHVYVALHEVTWLYGVHRSCRDGSSFMWHQLCQHCKYIALVNIQKCTIKKKVSHSCRITCEHSESAREQTENSAVYKCVIFNRSTTTAVTNYYRLSEGCRKMLTRRRQRSLWARQDPKLPAPQASHNLPSAMMMRSQNLSNFLMIGEEIRVASS